MNGFACHVDCPVVASGEGSESSLLDSETERLQLGVPSRLKAATTARLFTSYWALPIERGPWFTRRATSTRSSMQSVASYLAGERRRFDSRCLRPVRWLQGNHLPALGHRHACTPLRSVQSRSIPGAPPDDVMLNDERGHRHFDQNGVEFRLPQMSCTTRSTGSSSQAFIAPGPVLSQLTDPLGLLQRFAGRS